MIKSYIRLFLICIVVLVQSIVLGILYYVPESIKYIKDKIFLSEINNMFKKG